MKTLKLLMVILLTAPLIFSACDKDKDPSPIEDFGEGFPVNFNVEHPQNSLIDIISAEILGMEYKMEKIAEAKYNNGKGTITLPSVLKTEYLYDIASFFQGADTISDKTAKVTNVTFSASYKEDKKYAGWFATGIKYIYADKPVQIKGEFKNEKLILKYDLSFNTGWNGYNIIHSTDNEENMIENYTSEIINSNWQFVRGIGHTRD